MKKEDSGLNILERLINEDKITINNESIEMKKYRELEKKFRPNQNKLKDVLVFWDDITQYTTLGLIDCILEDKNEIIDKKYDYDLFFYRSEEDSYYIDFIIRLFKNQFKIDLTEEYIKKIQQDNYVKILKISPASSFFHSFIKCESLFKSISFCFRCNFNGIEKFVSSINDRFVTKNRIKLNCIVLDVYKDESDLLMKYGKTHNLFVMQYLLKGFEFLEKTQYNGASFISPYGHNGISNEYFSAVYAVYKNARFGPFNSEIVLFDEGISVC